MAIAPLLGPPSVPRSRMPPISDQLNACDRPDPMLASPTMRPNSLIPRARAQNPPSPGSSRIVLVVSGGSEDEGSTALASPQFASTAAPSSIALSRLSDQEVPTITARP